MKKIVLKPNGEYSIEIVFNFTTGHDLEIEYDTNLLEVTEESREPLSSNKKVIGSAQKVTYKVKALKEGCGYLTFYSHRPWEKQKEIHEEYEIEIIQ
jgi:predicted secreted protein